MILVKYCPYFQIVSMRQEARKAKLHTISKLVREVRRLRSKNGSEEQRTKNNRKADRFMEEVLIIKVGICTHCSCWKSFIQIIHFCHFVLLLSPVLTSAT
jgi:hypothetical protein